MNKPSFLFVGTAKAGTTSIYQYLKQHPEIAIPVKETFFFLRETMSANSLPYPLQRDKSDLILKQEEYDNVYRTIPKDKIVGEIGTGYLYHHSESIPLIKNELGTQTKICIILRNPVDRCFSSYMHFRKDLHESLDFEQSLNAESERIEKKYDFMWHHLGLSLYYEQVKAYMEHFDSVQVFFQDDLKKDPIGFLNELTAFIGTTKQIEWDLSKSFNPSGVPKNETLAKFITHENVLKSMLRPLFRLMFNKEKRERIRKNAKNKNLQKSDKPSYEQKLHLWKLMEKDVQNLEALLGKDLSHWKPLKESA